MMENVFISGSDKTPEVDFRFDQGLLKISGRSITENPIKFYHELGNFLRQYINSPQPITVFRVVLEYFNTSTSKCLVDLFKQLELLCSNGNDVRIEWYYEEDDDEIKDSGNDYKDIVNVPFEVKLIEGN